MQGNLVYLRKVTKKQGELIRTCPMDTRGFAAKSKLVRDIKVLCGSFIGTYNGDDFILTIDELTAKYKPVKATVSGETVWYQLKTS
ncbi:MAG: hypothetical protein ACI9TY_000054 [Alphaproteobacteria bacterium]|jgi:hypothetical protein